jgi:hypothetical protein
VDAEPWRRFRHERLVLLLILLTTFSVQTVPGVLDASRLAPSVSVLTRGTLNIDPYTAGAASDVSYRAGHWYSDKAPGLSLYALPATAIVLAGDRAAGEPDSRVWTGHWQSWLMRLVVNGPLLALLCLVVGRVGEGLVPGCGPIVAVAAGLGTLLGPVAPIMYEHVGGALLAFGSLSLVWRRRYGLGGLLAGWAVVFEYEAAIAVALVGAYVLLKGFRPAVRFVLGAVPAVAVLAVYDTLAFGSPLHVSSRYQAGIFAPYQQLGFFGFTLPSVSDFHGVLTGGNGFHVSRGILVTSPVLVAAAAGLVLWWRKGARHEALLCALVSAALLIFDAGYWDPYGGSSPGPRFLVPAIPFLLMGLPHVYGRFPRLTRLVVAVSVAKTTDNLLTWQKDNGKHFLADTVWAHAGLGLHGGVAAVVVLAGITTVVVLAPRPRRSRLPEPPASHDAAPRTA